MSQIKGLLVFCLLSIRSSEKHADTEKSDVTNLKRAIIERLKNRKPLNRLAVPKIFSEPITQRAYSSPKASRVRNFSQVDKNDTNNAHFRSVDDILSNVKMKSLSNSPLKNIFSIEPKLDNSNLIKKSGFVPHPSPKESAVKDVKNEIESKVNDIFGYLSPNRGLNTLMGSSHYTKPPISSLDPFINAVLNDPRALKTPKSLLEIDENRLEPEYHPNHSRIPRGAGDDDPYRPENMNLSSYNEDSSRYKSHTDIFDKNLHASDKVNMGSAPYLPYTDANNEYEDGETPPISGRTARGLSDSSKLIDPKMPSSSPIKAPNTVLTNGRINYTESDGIHSSPMYFTKTKTDPSFRMDSLPDIETEPLHSFRENIPEILKRRSSDFDFNPNFTLDFDPPLSPSNRLAPYKRDNISRLLGPYDPNDIFYPNGVKPPNPFLRKISPLIPSNIYFNPIIPHSPYDLLPHNFTYEPVMSTPDIRNDTPKLNPFYRQNYPDNYTQNQKYYQGPFISAVHKNPRHQKPSNQNPLKLVGEKYKEPDSEESSDYCKKRGYYPSHSQKNHHYHNESSDSTDFHSPKTYRDRFRRSVPNYPNTYELNEGNDTSSNRKHHSYSYKKQEPDLSRKPKLTMPQIDNMLDLINHTKKITKDQVESVATDILNEVIDLVEHYKNEIVPEIENLIKKQNDILISQIDKIFKSKSDNIIADVHEIRVHDMPRLTEELETAYLNLERAIKEKLCGSGTDIIKNIHDSGRKSVDLIGHSVNTNLQDIIKRADSIIFNKENKGINNMQIRYLESESIGGIYNNNYKNMPVKIVGKMTEVLNDIQNIINDTNPLFCSSASSDLTTTNNKIVDHIVEDITLIMSNVQHAVNHTVLETKSAIEEFVIKIVGSMRKKIPKIMQKIHPHVRDILKRGSRDMVIRLETVLEKGDPTNKSNSHMQNQR